MARRSNCDVRTPAHDLRLPRGCARCHSLRGRPLHHRGLLVHRLHLICKPGGDGGTVAVRYVRRHCSQRCHGVCRRSMRRRIGRNVARALALAETGICVTDSEPLPDRRVVVTALGVTQILAWGSTFYLLAVLAPYIARDTGWAYDRVMAGVSVGLLVAGIVSPRVGRFISSHGGRPVLAIGALLLAAGLAALGLAPNFPLYLAAWAIVGLGMGAGLYDAAFSTLGNIYGSQARSTITSVTLFGGFASTVCWPLSAYLVEAFGWREECFVYAMIQIAVALPLHLLALPRGRERRDVSE